MSTDPLKSIRESFRKGSIEEALRMARSFLDNPLCTPSNVTLLGKIIAPHLMVQSGGQRILLFGQCTTTWLRDSLTAQAWKRGIPLTAAEVGYDNVLQGLLETVEGENDFFVFLPWNQRLRFQLETKEKTFQEIIETELEFWQQVWRISEQKQARIVQIGYDYIGPGPMGFQTGSRFDGDLRLIRNMNDALRNTLPRDAYFVDLEALSGEFGRERFYCPRNYHWTKQPFSDEGIGRLAESIANAIRILRSGSKKVLVLDLDNTLWGGIVGETGPLGIELGEGIEGEAFRDFQRFCKELSKRGVLLAVASKNNDADAREPFEKNPEMVLKIDDIACFQAHWKPKSESMRTIAHELNLGIDSLVFFDDNPAEREEVRLNAPDVSVIDVPNEPSEYVRSLERSLFFETLAVTEADAKRTKQYLDENKRRSEEKLYTNLDDYLCSLDMKGRIDSITEENIQRVVQLLGKTNQFNLTTRRHDEATVRRLLESERSFGCVFSLIDKFGDYGVVGVAIVVPEENDVSVARLNSFLMSCRVINRTAEHFFMNGIIRRISDLGFTKLLGEYIPTPKNGLVKNLLSDFGFQSVGMSDEAEYWELTINSDAPLKTFVLERGEL